MQSISIILGKYKLQITPTSSLGPAQPMPTFSLLLLTILYINYSMYDVIFVRLKQNVSMVFEKYYNRPTSSLGAVISNFVKYFIY